MSSNWSANKQLTKRERFASPVAIAGLVCAGLLLLVMLYPEKSLLTLLSAPEVTTPSQQRYLEILVDLRTKNVELIFTLARSYLAASLPDKAQHALDHLQGTLPPRQAKSALTLQYEVRRQQLKALRPDDSRWPAARIKYADQVDRLLQAGTTSGELQRYQADAGRLGDMETAHRLALLLQKDAVSGRASPPLSESGETKADDAVVRGDYRTAAAVLFQHMHSAPPGEKRKFFLAGVRTLQSGNLLNEALIAAETHLNGLAEDRQTLVYLSRLALAANRPDRAQHYIRRALGIADHAQGGV